jgi:niacin transporter
MTVAALLIAIGIIIPMFSPAKIVIPPASFTLASHVPIFISMFISPAVAAAVAVGTTLGFLLGGFPFVIVLRAATHVIFAVLGAWWLGKRPGTLNTFGRSQLYSLVIGLIHGASELAIVTIVFFGGGMATSYYENGFLVSVLLLVGVGSVVHSMVDFAIALIIIKALSRNPSLRVLCANAN